MGTVYTLYLNGIPRRRENGASGYEGLFFLTSGFKDVLWCLQSLNSVPNKVR
jgi:hypothetical protein